MTPKRKREFPERPDIAPTLDQAPDTLGSGDAWEDVAFTGITKVDDRALGVRLRGCTWDDGDFVGKNLTGLDCRDVRFSNCDFAGAILEESNLVRVSFVSCRLRGFVLSGSTVKDLEVVDCDANMASMRMTKLSAAALRDTRLREGDFYGAEFTDVRFTGSDLGLASFDTATCTNVDLRGAKLERLIGATHLGNAQIQSTQVLELGAALIGELGFVVDAT